MSKAKLFTELRSVILSYIESQEANKIFKFFSYENEGQMRAKYALHKMHNLFVQANGDVIKFIQSFFDMLGSVQFVGSNVLKTSLLQKLDETLNVHDIIEANRDRKQVQESIHEFTIYDAVAPTTYSINTTRPVDVIETYYSAMNRLFKDSAFVNTELLTKLEENVEFDMPTLRDLTTSYLILNRQKFANQLHLLPEDLHNEVGYKLQ